LFVASPGPSIFAFQLYLAYPCSAGRSLTIRPPTKVTRFRQRGSQSVAPRSISWFADATAASQGQSYSQLSSRVVYCFWKRIIGPSRFVNTSPCRSLVCRGHAAPEVWKSYMYDTVGLSQPFRDLTQNASSIKVSDLVLFLLVIAHLTYQVIRYTCPSFTVSGASCASCITFAFPISSRDSLTQPYHHHRHGFPQELPCPRQEGCR